MHSWGVRLTWFDCNQSFKPGFHMIASIAVIAAISETKRVQRSQRQDRSYGNHIPVTLAIAATTITEIERNYLSDRVPYHNYDRCHR